LTPEQFCYWMQGFVEITNGVQPTKEQWAMMVEHLKTVFVKVTPPMPTGPVPRPDPFPDNKRIAEPDLDAWRKQDTGKWPGWPGPTIIC